MTRGAFVYMMKPYSLKRYCSSRHESTAAFFEVLKRHMYTWKIADKYRGACGFSIATSLPTVRTDLNKLEGEGLNYAHDARSSIIPH